ncbi:MAG: chromosomal replication initiator protein DnaA [Desulfobacterales bacterium]|nr:chromosomal replication initiator protein DnaA [Deltaproteobacteria bacterium]NNL77529.1 chromosomal replication initiator protein DnaA [Desulfobacterales bacterium]
MEPVWKKVKSAIKQHIPGHSFKMWIEPLNVSKAGESSYVVYCPNFFSKKRVQGMYADIIKNAIQSTQGQDCELSFKISSENNGSKNKIGDHHQMPLPNTAAHQYNGHFLRRDFTFEQFVVGNNNDFAYSASLSLASRKNTQQNALFLLSNTGMGKSHLSQAIGHHVLSVYPRDRVYYITAEDFSNEMVQAYRHNVIDKFKSKYRKQCDVLLLEDVHYLSGKERTQIELALTLDTLLESGKRIIFSSCYLPTDIPKLNDKLRSRLSCGLISTIDPPSFRTRVRILKKKVGAKGYRFPDNVIQYLAGELTDDVRQLESGLNGVAAKSSLLGMPIDLNLAESVVKNIVRQRQRITIGVIKKLVCKYYNVSIEDVMSRSRKQNLVRPRQVAIYLSRRYTDASLQSIGKSFNRYHATALHSINCIERGLKQNSSIQKQVGFFRQKLESGKF